MERQTRCRQFTQVVVDALFFGARRAHKLSFFCSGKCFTISFFHLLFLSFVFVVFRCFYCFFSSLSCFVFFFLSSFSFFLHVFCVFWCPHFDFLLFCIWCPHFCCIWCPHFLLHLVSSFFFAPGVLTLVASGVLTLCCIWCPHPLLHLVSSPFVASCVLTLCCILCPHPLLHLVSSPFVHLVSSPFVHLVSSPFCASCENITNIKKKKKDIIFWCFSMFFVFSDHFWPAPILARTTVGRDRLLAPFFFLIKPFCALRDAFTRTRLMPTFGVSAGLLLNIAGRRSAMISRRPAEGPKVGV